jgi:predicted O-linked N-acetylglucosamine transferase (SPINDLY family)
VTNGKITFGSFNIVPKLNQPLIRIWAEILNELPDSEILLKAKQFKDEQTQKRYRELFEYFGVAGSRVHIVPFTSSFREHMDMYGRVDIALDPFPYNGTTTICEALWMGVPTLTRRGRCHSSRVGAGINSRLELYDFIADDEKSYIQKALKWAGRREDLTRLRGELRARTRESSLCDGVGLTASLEEHYRKAAEGLDYR